MELLLEGFPIEVFVPKLKNNVDDVAIGHYYSATPVVVGSQSALLFLISKVAVVEPLQIPRYFFG